MTINMLPMCHLSQGWKIKSVGLRGSLTQTELSGNIILKQIVVLGPWSSSGQCSQENEVDKQVSRPDLAREDRKEKAPWQWQKFQSFQRWHSGGWIDGAMVLMEQCCWIIVCN
jgi:hypothetical protein